MLAEIKGKISKSGSNLKERLEDNLTGNVFGVLRYISFSTVLGEIFSNGVYPNSVGVEFKKINSDFWADKIQFWPYDPEGEIDILIEFEEIIVGIEVKYKSGLSSDDEVSNAVSDEHQVEKEKSINQLARESRIVSMKGRNKKKILLFIADRQYCKDVYSDVVNRNILEKDVAFGYISWQEILVQFKKLSLINQFHQLILKDTIALLKRKGFEDFTSMNVDLTIPIDANDYFRFHVENKPKIDFQSQLTINGGQYYEF